MDTLLQIVVIVILTLLEGVFVAAEIALVTMRRSRIDQLVDEGNRSARRVKSLVAQPGRFLAVTQIGLTFLGFLASAYAAVNLTTEPRTALRRVRAALPCLVCWRARADHRDPDPEPVHDRLRRARAKEPRPRPHRGVRAPPERLHRRHAAHPRAARPRPDRGHQRHRRDARCRRAVARRDEHRGAQDPRRARRPAGHPRGRGGADDPRGHRARRPARPRGHGPAHRDGHPAGDRLDGAGDRRRHRARATAASRSTRRPSTRSSASSTPRTCCRSSRVRSRSGRACARSCGRRSSCPSR